MDITLLKNHLDDYKKYIDSIDKSIEENKLIINELYKSYRAIKNIIWKEEMEERNKLDLKTVLIDGYNVIIPEFMSGFREGKVYKVIDGELYSIPQQYKEDKDGSFHMWAYAYVKLAEDKHVRITVSMLGRDSYGDRIFTESQYYKKIESDFHYYSKDYGKNNRFPDTFKKQVLTIIDEFNKLEGVNEFNPLKKSK